MTHAERTGTTLRVPPSERLIVLPLTNGIAQTGTLHLPAVTITEGWTPYRLKAVCGVSGVVYNQAGFPDAEVCEACLAPSCGPSASVTRYVDHGCRCPDCRAAMSGYRKARYDAQTGEARVCPGCGGVKSPNAKKCMGCEHEHVAAHGTNSRYSRGCRCRLCVVAHSTYMRGYRERIAA